MEEETCIICWSSVPRGSGYRFGECGHGALCEKCRCTIFNSTHLRGTFPDTWLVDGGSTLLVECPLCRHFSELVEDQ